MSRRTNRSGNESDARTINKRGNELYQSGHYVEAEAAYFSAASAYELVLGPDHAHTRQCLENAAAAIRQQGRTREADVWKRWSQGFAVATD